MDAKVQIEVSIGQARVISEALDLLVSLHLGQLESLTTLVASGQLPVLNPHELTSRTVDHRFYDAFEGKVRDLKILLGLPTNGNLSIGDLRTSQSSKRAFEILKTVNKALDEHLNPDAQFEGKDFDTLSIRYTSDPVPVVTVKTSI